MSEIESAEDESDEKTLLEAPLKAIEADAGTDGEAASELLWKANAESA